MNRAKQPDIIAADEKSVAIERGLRFIYDSACNAENFSTYGYDYLCCFATIASTANDRALRDLAREMGRERAWQWRQHLDTTEELDADSITYLVFGSHSADMLGVRDHDLKKEIRRVARKFDAEAYFGFDATTEPPPKDIPIECKCGEANSRGRKTCRNCKRRLGMKSSYEVWLDALIISYMGGRYGVRLGCSVESVLRWVPMMRPYPDCQQAPADELRWATYAVTHIIYILNDYNRFNLSPSWLPQEFAFLKANVQQAIETEDPETLGELLDTLKSFGVSKSSAIMRQATRYLLSTQNSDGSWGDIEATDAYDRYHPTWTAIDGLRDYSWRGKRISRKSLERLVRNQLNRPSDHALASSTSLNR